MFLHHLQGALLFRLPKLLNIKIINILLNSKVLYDKMRIFEQIIIVKNKTTLNAGTLWSI